MLKTGYFRVVEFDPSTFGWGSLCLIVGKRLVLAIDGLEDPKSRIAYCEWDEDTKLAYGKMTINDAVYDIPFLADIIWALGLKVEWK